MGVGNTARNALFLAALPHSVWEFWDPRDPRAWLPYPLHPCHLGLLFKLSQERGDPGCPHAPLCHLGVPRRLTPLPDPPWF